MLFISDSLVSVLALTKGRTSGAGLVRPVCQFLSLALRRNVHTHLRWLASEANPSDALSRAGRTKSPAGEQRSRVLNRRGSDSVIVGENALNTKRLKTPNGFAAREVESMLQRRKNMADKEMADHQEESKYNPSRKEGARLRRRVYGAEAIMLQRMGRTVLEHCSVGYETQRQYLKALVRLEMFGGKIVQEMTVGELDANLAELMQACYFDGEGGNIGNVLMSAVGWMMPVYSRNGRSRLPRASLALRGLGRLAPPTSRLPLPMSLVYALALNIASKGQKGGSGATKVG